jgi:hypothetical protein
MRTTMSFAINKVKHFLKWKHNFVNFKQIFESENLENIDIIEQYQSAFFLFYSVS